MKAAEFITIIALLILFVGTLFLLWTYIPTEQVKYEEYKAEVSADLPVKSTQFYPNMRYPDSQITYKLSSTCSEKKKQNFLEAVQVLESKTVLTFRKTITEKPDITITCSNLSPEPDQKDHFVAGEGGPSLFLNGTRYATILEGEIALYREETCDEPKVALHELLHALGFDHNSNEESIMFPVTNCKQTLDKEIVEEINKLYSPPSLADLAIEKIEANKTGRYLNFELMIGNSGLKKLNSATIEIIVEDEIIKTFTIGEVDIGAKRRLTVSNLRLPRNADEIKFSAKTSEPEITKENNEAIIKIFE